MSVLTEQTVTITLPAGTLTATASLTGITDYTQCVPIMTERITTLDDSADEYGEYAVRVAVEAGSPPVVRATTESNGTPRALVVEVGVWEFDGTDDVVHSGQIVDTASQSWNDSLTLDAGTALTDLFLVWSWSVEGGANWNHIYNITGKITDLSNVDFSVVGGTGVDATINWYVVESLAGTFSSQAASVSIADLASSGTDTITDQGDTGAKTFIVGGYAGGSVADRDRNQHGTVDVRLESNGTTITVERYGTQGAIEWNGHAVTMSGANAKVQRGTIANESAGDTTVDLTAGGYTSAGTGAAAHAAGSMASSGCGAFASDSGNQAGDAYCAFALEDGGDTLRMQRYSSGDNTNKISWEVIEWDTGGAEPPATRRVMVIT